MHLLNINKNRYLSYTVTITTLKTLQLDELVSDNRTTTYRSPLSPTLMYLSKMESIFIQYARITHPTIPPTTISAGLWTPKYSRLNITETDPVRNKETIPNSFTSNKANNIIVIKLINTEKIFS